MKSHSKLDYWYLVDNLTRTEISNDHTKPSFDEYYVKPALKSSKKILTQALVLDSGANIHIFNNPNFLSNIITGLAQAVNTFSSRVVCDKIGCLYDTLYNLPFPSTGYYFQLSWYCQHPWLVPII